MTETVKPEDARPLTIGEHIHEIQTRVRAPKDEFNKHGGFSYRTAEGILAAAKSCLPDGAYITMSDRVEDIAGKLFLVATVKITIGAESVSSEAYAMHPIEQKGMSPSQITGAASSYARKYALCGLLAIDDSDEDPDKKAQPKHDKQEATAPVAAMTPASSRDRMLGALGKVTTPKQFTDLTERQQFKDALAKLAEDAPPMALQVTAEIGKLQSKLIIADDIPEEFK